MRFWDLINRPTRPAQTIAPASRGASNARAASTFAADLTFEAIECRFGATAALKGITLEIARGEVMCLLGPSGCGKTTLLRIASGIERPTGGRVLINGIEVAGPAAFVPPEQRNVGLMFQDFALFPHLSIADNVAFGLPGLARVAARREAIALLSRVGLERFADEFPHTLSGGEQQRVALARAIVPRPSVMLMDEPFSGLDVQLRERMQSETLTLLRETRATCMIVTHDPLEAMRLADRIAVMRAGRLVQVGTAEQLYRAPADLLVARLFSEINEIELPVIGGALHTPFGTFRAPELIEGETAILCIRRRAIDITPTDAPADQARLRLPGRVLRSRFMGDQVLLDIGVQGLEQPLTTSVREGDAPPTGAQVRLAIDPASVLVFQPPPADAA